MQQPPMNDPKYWHYEQMPKDAKGCPTCGNKMITDMDNIVMASYPAQWRWGWWCGGCGHKELGGIHRDETDEEMKLQRWRQGMSRTSYLTTEDKEAEHQLFLER